LCAPSFETNLPSPSQQRCHFITDHVNSVDSPKQSGVQWILYIILLTSVGKTNET
ncbi:hypothetical protein C0J52_25688, partial [Blattella germanica]